MMSKVFATTSNYKQFDNNASDSQTSASPEPPHAIAANTAPVSLDTAKIVETEKLSVIDYKERARQRLLTRVQIFFAFLILVLGSVVTGISSRSYWGWGADSCHAGTGVWVGIVGIIAAVSGVIWIQRVHTNAINKGSYGTAYFILTIIATVGDAILVVTASVCMSQALFYKYYAKLNNQAWSYLVINEAHLAVIALDGVVIALAILNAVANILASILVCRSWWLYKEQKESPLTLVYISDSLSNTRLPTICIENGTRVMFLPTQSVSGAAVVNGSNTTMH